MNSPEQVHRLQTQLSECSGTKKVGDWMIVLLLGLLAAGIVDAVLTGESLLRVLPLPLMLLAQWWQTRSAAKRRTEELEQELS